MKSNDIKILDSGWMEVPFSYMAEHISKRVDPKDTDLDIYIGLEHIDPYSLKIKRYGKPEDVKGTKLIAQPGDIIFGKRRAYQGKVGLCEWDAIVSAHSMVLRPKEENIEKDFLKFFMQSEEFYNRSIQISEGSLSPTIKWKVLEGQRFVIPPREKQQELISNLVTLENLFNKKNILLDRVKIYKEKLNRDLMKVDQIKYYKHHLRDNFKVMKLEDISLNMKSGGTPQSTNKEYYNGNIPFVKVEDITNSSKYLNKTETYITKLGLENSSSWLVPKKSILYSMYASVGFVCINNIDVSTNQAVISIIPNTEIVNLEYLYYYLDAYKVNIDRLIAATTQKNLNAAKVKDFDIIIPDMNTQKKICDILSNVDKMIFNILREIDKLLNLKNILIKNNTELK